VIHLYGFAPIWGLVDLSPFVTKADIYLRLANLPFRLVPFSMESFAAAPKGKLPYIVDGHEKIADSGFIVRYLKAKYGDPLDAKLGPVERAAGHAVTRMLEENFYWVIVAERWRDSRVAIENYPVMIGQPPEFVKTVVDTMLDELGGHGMGRHTADEIENLGRADLTALSNLLGDKPYLLGAEPTSYDATVYSFVAHTTQPEYDSRMKRSILFPISWNIGTAWALSSIGNRVGRDKAAGNDDNQEVLGARWHGLGLDAGEHANDDSN
jgi:glutathione S-transferase